MVGIRTQSLMHSDSLMCDRFINIYGRHIVKSRNTNLIKIIRYRTFYIETTDFVSTVKCLLTMASVCLAENVSLWNSTSPLQTKF
jgi:hypothetical protein